MNVEYANDEVFQIFRRLRNSDNPPIKLYEKLKREMGQTVKTMHTVCVTARMADTIICSLFAQGLPLRAGTVFNRVFTYRDNKWALENGVSRNLYASGAISLPEKTTAYYEVFSLEALCIEGVVAHHGVERLRALGLVH